MVEDFENVGGDRSLRFFYAGFTISISELCYTLLCMEE